MSASVKSSRVVFNRDELKLKVSSGVQDERRILGNPRSERETEREREEREEPVARAEFSRDIKSK